MTKTRKKLLSAASLLVLMAVMALSVISCDIKKEEAETPADPVEVTITVEITDDTGKMTPYVIKTEQTSLRGALEQENLIEGEEGQYGLYIKKVCGITADYDVDGAYWALYKNGEYLTSSVDDEKLEDGAVYQITYTK